MEVLVKELTVEEILGSIDELMFRAEGQMKHSAARGETWGVTGSDESCEVEIREVIWQVKSSEPVVMRVGNIGEMVWQGDGLQSVQRRVTIVQIIG